MNISLISGCSDRTLSSSSLVVAGTIPFFLKLPVMVEGCFLFVHMLLVFSYQTLIIRSHKLDMFLDNIKQKTSSFPLCLIFMISHLTKLFLSFSYAFLHTFFQHTNDILSQMMREDIKTFLVLVMCAQGIALFRAGFCLR